MLEPLRDGPPKCNCEKTEIRRRTLSNGTKSYVEQCLQCGRQLRSVKKESVKAPWAILPFDEDVKAKWDEQFRHYWKQCQADLAQQREQQNEEWWRRYDAHLNSPEWRKICAKVHRRAQRICEGCAERPSVCVHHLTYVRMGHEMLFDLVALCQQCHDAVHGKDTSVETGHPRERTSWD